MKKNNLVIAALTIVILASFTVLSVPKTFSDLLVRAKMSFSTPKGFIEQENIENRRFNYSYALKYPDKNFEVRYAIRPMDNLLKEYNEKEKNKKPGESNIHPNKWYTGTFQNTLLTVSGGQNPEITVLDKQLAKKEYNADWAATAYIVPAKEFGREYSYCKVLAIHKDNCGDAYYFFLSDNKEHVDQLLIPVSHNLKFK